MLALGTNRSACIGTEANVPLLRGHAYRCILLVHAYIQFLYSFYSNSGVDKYNNISYLLCVIKIVAKVVTLLIFYRLRSSLGGSRLKGGVFEEHKYSYSGSQKYILHDQWNGVYISIFFKSLLI